MIFNLYSEYQAHLKSNNRDGGATEAEFEMDMEDTIPLESSEHDIDSNLENADVMDCNSDNTPDTQNITEAVVSESSEEALDDPNDDFDMNVEKDLTEVDFHDLDRSINVNQLIRAIFFS